MYDLIAIGDITIDLFYKGESLTQKDDRFYLAIGGKYLADEFHETLGGGGANVAAGATHYGLNTGVLGKIGENSFKQIIIQKLIRKGVSTEFLLTEREYLNISSILLSGSGERTIVHYATPHETFAVSPIMMDKLLRTEAVYMGNLPGISMNERVDLLSFFKKNEVVVALNFGREDCKSGISAVSKLTEYADILILNTFEFAEIINKKKESIKWEEDISKFLPKKIKPYEKIIVITDAENGSFVYSQSKVLRENAIKPQKIIDTTGAGDAYTSGFLSSFIKDKNLEQAMKRGSENAARILAKIGAQ